MIVRQATDEDYKQLDSLCEKFFSEGGLKGVPQNFSAGLRKHVDAGVALCLVLVKQDVVVGTIGAMISEDFITNDLICTEMFWYVEPDHRRQGIKLHKALEKEAKKYGCERIYMVHLAKLKADKLERYYRKCGYEPLEVFYSKDLK
jgi:GNAT superfamily N-acetyltransferase